MGLAVQEISRGVDSVAYETKVLLIALAEIIRKTNDVKEIYRAVEKMANAEGVILEPYEQKTDEIKN